ncbi:MAG: sialidase family protein [Planctomycetota bacterium]
MPKIEVVDSGHVDRSDSAFPTLVQLDNRDIICGFSVGEGPDVTGGTHWARSRDGGRTWTHEGEILPPSEKPKTTNHLRLSRTADNAVLAYGARDHRDRKVGPREHPPNEPVLCISTDGARTWSAPRVMPNPLGVPLEISNPILATSDGRWLAPAATVTTFDRYGEKVVLFESRDGGKTWSATHTAFEDPAKKTGYLEQKFVELAPGRILGVCWTMSYVTDSDLEDHFALSEDGGRSWSEPYPTGIRGQTMKPTWLGGDRLLVLYNRRYGRQGVQMCLVRLAGKRWEIDFEGTMWDAEVRRERASAADSIDELKLFAFGYPWALRLDERNVLAVHWCKEEERFGIRWTRLAVTM